MQCNIREGNKVRRTHVELGVENRALYTASDGMKDSILQDTHFKPLRILKLPKPIDEAIHALNLLQLSSSKSSLLLKVNVVRAAHQLVQGWVEYRGEATMACSLDHHTTNMVI